MGSTESPQVSIVNGLEIVGPRRRHGNLPTLNDARRAVQAFALGFAESSIHIRLVTQISPLNRSSLATIERDGRTSCLKRFTISSCEKAPEIPPMLFRTDFPHQKLMLRQSLLEMMIFAQMNTGRGLFYAFDATHVDFCSPKVPTASKGRWAPMRRQEYTVDRPPPRHAFLHEVRRE